MAEKRGMSGTPPTTERPDLLKGDAASRVKPTTPPAATPSPRPLPRWAAPTISSLAASKAATRQVRVAEPDRDRLRSVDIRLNYERDPGPSLIEAENRLLRLRLQELAAQQDESAERTQFGSGGFRTACATDLLFLMDTTGSMGRYIETAKAQVRSIVEDVCRASFNEAEVRVAVVGYKDHKDDPHIQFIDFTTETDRVLEFLGTLTATGGDDMPEDVLGGLNKAVSMSWKHATRCIIHIADAPPHSRTYAVNGSSHRDNYPEPGSEPHHLVHDPILNEMIQLNINYFLLRINNSTDLMAFKFLKAYADVSPNCRLLDDNKHCADARNWVTLRAAGPGRRNPAGLKFQEMKLGISYDSIRHLVVRSVTASTTLTGMRIFTPQESSRLPSGARPSPLRNSRNITPINEDAAGHFRLEAVAPRWDQPGWLGETLKVEAYFPEVGPHGVTGSGSVLDAMMDDDGSIGITTTDLTIFKRARPFAEGVLRVATYARTANSTNRLVVKNHKRTPLGAKGLPHLLEEMRIQALCKAFALEFNALSEAQHSIDFITSACLVPKRAAGNSDSRRECMSLEPFIEGTYVKYNGNAGYVNDAVDPADPFHQAAQAFSHFTFERSAGRFLVSDLQGVGHALTDPAIHTRDRARFRLSRTNFGVDGFKHFFRTHACGDICRRLALRSTGWMVAQDRLEGLRTDWPPMTALPAEGMRVCCSNKLCSRIVLLSSAQKSPRFPEYHWCKRCWPQLARSETSLVCGAPDAAKHQFIVSRFFYESQGTIVPRTCERHRNGGDPAVGVAEEQLIGGEESGAAVAGTETNEAL